MDANNRCYYLLALTQRWLSIRVESIGACITFCAALIIVIQRNTLSAGESGVSLTYAISVTQLLNWVVKQVVEAENAMNSVERSKFYTDKIAQEAPAIIAAMDEPLKAKWPEKGQISFENLQIRYRDGLPLVLHGISLDIKGGERIGIVGRTSVQIETSAWLDCVRRNPISHFFAFCVSLLRCFSSSVVLENPL
jgi:ATP-binding cassette subfamily C (CFTR/MRP) protein 1